MNYKKVIEDFNNGIIDKDIVTLVMDNDGTFWRVDTGDENKDEDMQIMLEEKYGDGDGYRDIVDVLCAAGVNCDWC